MKILVPSDFSASSNNASLYAVQFAKKVNAEIFLLHVVHIAHPPMVQITEFIDHKIEDIRIAEASKDGVLLVNDLKSQVKGVRISFKVITGFPVENAIEGFVKDNEIDLIIMGAKGTNGLSKLLFGGTAVAVINKSSVPVITVPESSIFNDVKRIVYASDMHENQHEILKIILIAKLFDTFVHILHILPPESKKKIDTVGVESVLINEYKYQKISFHVAHSVDILDGINEFVSQIKADILVMYTHRFRFFESIFKTSFSREEVSHSLVPLLTLKNESG